MQTFKASASENRLLIIDWASLSYQTIFGLDAESKKVSAKKQAGLAHVNNYGMEVDLSRPDSTIKSLKNSTLARVIDLMQLFNPSAVLISLEGGKNWRYDFFPEYKGNRVFADWPFVITKAQFTEATIEIAETIALMFNAHVIRNINCEGDDVVAIATKYLHDSHHVTTIASGDKDMVQLMKYRGVEVYDIRTGTYRSCDGSAKFFLESKVLMGDPSDNIPPVVLPGKKRGLGKVTAPQVVLECSGDVYSLAEKDGWLDQYMFNKTLIDMDFIPVSIDTEILNLLRESKSKEFDYMSVLDANFTGVNMMRYDKTRCPVMSRGVYQWRV